MFVPSYSFELTEHDAERPWIVLRRERHTVTLDDGVNFFVWARGVWPPSQFTVQLDPYQLPEGRRYVSGTASPSNGAGMF
jgi:hypothetical protein